MVLLNVYQTPSHVTNLAVKPRWTCTSIIRRRMVMKARQLFNRSGYLTSFFYYYYFYYYYYYYYLVHYYLVHYYLVHYYLVHYLAAILFSPFLAPTLFLANTTLSDLGISFSI